MNRRQRRQQAKTNRRNKEMQRKPKRAHLSEVIPLEYVHRYVLYYLFANDLELFDELAKLQGDYDNQHGFFNITNTPNDIEIAYVPWDVFEEDYVKNITEVLGKDGAQAFVDELKASLLKLLEQNPEFLLVLFSDTGGIGGFPGKYREKLEQPQFVVLSKAAVEQLGQP